MARLTIPAPVQRGFEFACRIGLTGKFVSPTAYQKVVVGGRFVSPKVVNERYINERGAFTAPAQSYLDASAVLATGYQFIDARVTAPYPGHPRHHVNAHFEPPFLRRARECAVAAVQRCKPFTVPEFRARTTGLFDKPPGTIYKNFRHERSGLEPTQLQAFDLYMQSATRQLVLETDTAQTTLPAPAPSRIILRGDDILSQAQSMAEATTRMGAHLSPSQFLFDLLGSGLPYRGQIPAELKSRLARQALAQLDTEEQNFVLGVFHYCTGYHWIGDNTWSRDPRHIRWSRLPIDTPIPAFTIDHFHQTKNLAAAQLMLNNARTVAETVINPNNCLTPRELLRRITTNDATPRRKQNLLQLFGVLYANKVHLDPEEQQQLDHAIQHATGYRYLSSGRWERISEHFRSRTKPTDINLVSSRITLRAGRLAQQGRWMEPEAFIHAVLEYPSPYARTQLHWYLRTMTHTKQQQALQGFVQATGFHVEPHGNAARLQPEPSHIRWRST